MVIIVWLIIWFLWCVIIVLFWRYVKVMLHMRQKVGNILDFFHIRHISEPWFLSWKLDLEKLYVLNPRHVLKTSQNNLHNNSRTAILFKILFFIFYSSFETSGQQSDPEISTRKVEDDEENVKNSSDFCFRKHTAVSSSQNNLLKH